MVAYSFKRRFVGPIQSGSKCQTIRADRKRHAIQGEELQLYTGMRTKACEMIGRAACINVAPIRIDVENGRIELESGTALTTLAELDAFARIDGFEEWGEMRRFWEENHPDIRVFSGVLIRWCDIALPATAAP